MAEIGYIFISSEALNVLVNTLINIALSLPTRSSPNGKSTGIWCSAAVNFGTWGGPLRDPRDEMNIGIV